MYQMDCILWKIFDGEYLMECVRFRVPSRLSPVVEGAGFRSAVTTVGVVSRCRRTEGGRARFRKTALSSRSGRTQMPARTKTARQYAHRKDMPLVRRFGMAHRARGQGHVSAMWCSSAGEKRMCSVWRRWQRAVIAWPSPRLLLAVRARSLRLSRLCHGYQAARIHLSWTFGSKSSS